MSIKKTHIANIRREYSGCALSEQKVLASPFEQFDAWLQEVLQTDLPDPTAMTLASVDPHGIPDLRVVLLKDVKENRFIFYTNYLSTKGMQLAAHPYAALNFYWPLLHRQVRIRGKIEKVSADLSDQYFASRPKMSQLSAIASKQSSVIASRATLENRMREIRAFYEHKPIERPAYWGGYGLTPFEFEFWQGRDNRLHDRVRYRMQAGDSWCIERLAP